VAEQSEEFVSFEKALRDLKLQSEDLRKLVSEGGIRAFRDGQSMKFKREDLEALKANQVSDDDLVFTDALEDDTGMVTEELSEEDTLLAEEDFEEAAVEAAPVTRSTRARARVEEEAAVAHEPGWVTGVAILCAVVMIYGLMVVYSVTTEQPPSGLTGMFASR
jgi:excisionase family DNA binding protein